MKLQAVILTTFLLAASLPADACTAHSGPNTAALVELYTSEGCSSCPPADRELHGLGALPDAVVVPLALHVGYWDRLGWADRFAQERFAARQEWLARVNQRRAVYTPQFFVSGAELQPWNHAALRDTVRQANANPSSAAIRLHTAFSADRVLTVDAQATAPARKGTAVLYLAVAENGLATRVMRGENQGATLLHDHVVRAWLGPFRLDGGAARVRREITLPPDWQRERLETVAFVQDERSGRVLQALRSAACPGA